MELKFEDHLITKEVADELKKDHAFHFGAGTPEKPKAHHFEAEQVKQLLNHPEIKTFTVSKGYNQDQNQEVVILEGYNADGKSLGIYLDMSCPCPPYCYKD